jgi:peptidoglycan/LPS O-acetylase OafA/YrhL
MRAGAPGTRTNNFESLRLVAACLVLVSHAFLLIPGGSYIAVGHANVGGLGVTMFFAISGFLIAQSWRSDPRIGPFAWKRLLRIMPALWVMLLVTTYVMGPLLTDLSLGDYLAAPDTHMYFAANAVMDEVSALPGVFGGETVNDSLWTLPLELKAYAMLALLGLAGAIRRRGSVLAITAGMFALGIPVDAHGTSIAAHVGLMDPAPLHLTTVFLCGTVLCLYRERVPLRASVAAALAVLWIATAATPVQALTSAVAFSYGCVFLAYRTPAIRLRGDISYGVYLYGAPVQLAAVGMLGTAASGPLVLAVTTPVVAALGLASWRLVEAPSLRLKDRVPGRRSPRPAAAATAAAGSPTAGA